MWHRSRGYMITRIEDIDELIDRLTTHYNDLSDAFEFNGILLLNDSLNENGIREYAVARCVQGHWIQYESLTIDWITAEDLRQFIRESIEPGTDWPQWVPISPHQLLGYQPSEATS